MMAPEMIKRAVDSLLLLGRQNNNVWFSSKTDDNYEEEYQLPLLSPSPPTSPSLSSSNIDYDDDKYLKIEEQKQEQDRKSLVLLLFLLAVAGLTGTISCFYDEIIIMNRRRSTASSSSLSSSTSSTTLSGSINNNNHDDDEDDDGIIIKQKLSISISSTDTAKIFEEEVATPDFVVHRRRGNSGAPPPTTTAPNPTLIDYIITKWKKQTEMEIIQNVGGGIRWIRPYLLPPTDSSSSSSSKMKISSKKQQQEQSKLSQGYHWLRYGNPWIPQHRQQPEAVNKLIPQHRQQPEAVYTFEKEWDEILQTDADHHHPTTTTKPVVAVVEDYRDPHKKYETSHPRIPSTQQEIAVAIEAGFETIENRLKRWPPEQQNPDIIINDNTFKETLHHLDYQNPQHRQLAKALQQADLPYKLINVPEVVEAGKKWSDDEYVANELLKVRYYVEESPDNFFLHDYIESSWDVESMGLPLIRRNYVMPYKTWSKHAKYADATQLPFDKPHFDLLAATTVVKRNEESFFSRELPSFMSDKTTFFVPNPAKTGKRTCRFSERGSITNIHMESTGNHIAMVSGAQRVLITPPNQCTKLGIRQYHVSSSSSSSSSSPSDDHHPAPSSMLNLGHMSFLLDYYHRNNMTTLTITTDDEAYIEDGSENAAPTILSKDRISSSSSSSNTGAASQDGMSKEERYWLQKAGHALSVETVLKEGEVLFIPSYWPSYTISLQKSAQCTVPYNTPAGDAGSPKVGAGMDAFNQCNRYL